MSYTQTVYYRFAPDYNDGIFDNGKISSDVLSAVYDRLIAKRLPSCLSWCGDEILGPHEPDAEEQKELDDFPGFIAVQNAAWEEFCALSDEDIVRIYCQR